MLFGLMWRLEQRESFFNVEKLADFLQLTEEKRSVLLHNSKFKLNLPRRLANKIQKNCLEDPILKQFVPTVNESVILPHLKTDPVADATFRKEKKLLHKYEGRALLVATSACAMHCRYCFRQNFDYEKEDKSFQNELKVLQDDASIEEIILSGGDPLSLSNQVLEKLIKDLEAIPHLKRLRFHTRFPIGIPERIDASFLNILANTRFQIWFVIHANHPLELDQEVLHALKQIQKLGIPVLNQAVLLKGINDDPVVLKALMQILVNAGILPYYLHQLDPVQGAAHFEVEEEEGRALIATLSRELPGYAIPKYVREIPGQPHKTIV